MRNPNDYLLLFYKLITGTLGNSSLARVLRLNKTDQLISKLYLAELMVLDGLSSYNTLHGRKDRASLLGILLFGDIQDLTERQLTKRIHNIEVILNDIHRHVHSFQNKPALYVDSTKPNGGGFIIHKGSSGFIAGSTQGDVPLDQRFWENLSLGLAGEGSYRRMLKPFVANNHLLGKLLSSPDDFLHDILTDIDQLNIVMPKKKDVVVSLENRSDLISKIDDLTVSLSIPALDINVDGHQFNLGEHWVRCTFDSKFYINPDNIKSDKVISQQIQLALGDRGLREISNLFNKIVDSDGPNSAKEEAIARLTPLFFKHYVVRPKDTRPISDAVKEAYAKRFEDEAFVYVELLSDDFPAYVIDGFEKGLLAHAEKHFRQGAFVSDNSDLFYFDIPL